MRQRSLNGSQGAGQNNLLKKLMNKKSATHEVEKSQDEESEEDQMYVSARGEVMKFNKRLDKSNLEYLEQYPEREVTFDNNDILEDAENVQYTYPFEKSAADASKKQGGQQVDLVEVAEDLDSDDSENAKMKNQNTENVLGKLNDLYQQAADGETKYDAEHYHWEVLKQWRRDVNNVKYKCIRDIKGYSFKAEDEQGYFRHKVDECANFFNKKITDSRSQGGEVELNILSHFEMNQLTGEKFLRLALRQWKTSYDPEIIRSKNNKRSYQKRRQTEVVADKEYEIHSIKFLKFDEELQEFEQEDELLYDISTKFLNLNASGFNNDFFLTKNEHTYYFTKDEIHHGFRLQRHSYGTPFQKFPVDNDPFPIHSNEVLDKYFIQAPKDKRLDDLQICFMKCASGESSLKNEQLMEEIDFLSNQYVLIHDKIYKNNEIEAEREPSNITDVYIVNVSSGEIIYDSTKDETLERPFENFQVGFFLADNANNDEEFNTVFVIKCQKMDYQVKISKNGPEVQFERSQGYQRYSQHMLLPQCMDIHLERLQENFTQRFFFSKINSNVNFIYPIQSSKEENISSDIKNKQEEVSKHIQQHFLDNESGKIAFQNSEFAFILNENFKDKILTEINTKGGFKVNDEYISTQDTILKVNLSENEIHVWTVKPQYEYTSFRETLTEIQDNKQKLLQQIILQQFNLDNQKVYSNNYNIKDTLGIQQNQYLNRVYLTTREGVYLWHHKIYALDKDEPVKIIEVPEDILLIDLGPTEDGQTPADQVGQISMIRLYEEKLLFNFDQKCDIKLVSYHISYSEQLVAFFFIQRNNHKQSELYTQQSNQSGVEFMAVYQIEKLRQMADKFAKGEKKCSILQKYTPVFIFGANVKKLMFTHYDHDVLVKYQDNSKAASLMASTLVHEMVYDPKNPIDKIAPFLYSSEKPRKTTPIFQWYFCFMDITLCQKHIEKSTLFKAKVEELNLDNFCDLFLLRNVEDPIMSLNADADNIIYENCRTRDCPIFCRSGPWRQQKYNPKKADKGRDFEDVTTEELSENDREYCTHFQIGFAMNPNDTQMFEIYGYLVNFHSKEIYRNTDLIDVFNLKVDDTKSNTKIEPYRLQHVMPSSSANELFIGNQKYWENHRMIPIINNQGRISGTYLMMNLYMIFKENVMITDETDEIVNQKKNIGEDFLDIILENAGEEVLLLRTMSTTKGLIYLKSGRQYEVPLDILIDENNTQLSKKLQPKPLFVYGMVSCSNSATPGYDPQTQLKTPIMQVGYKQFAMDGQPGRLITLCTSKLNKDVIENQIFDRLTMQQLLHQQQVYNITSSIPSFKEIFKSKQKQKAMCYFQFRYVFYGRSFCSLEYPSFKNSIKNLMYAVNDIEIDLTKICEDSAIYQMLDYSTDVEEENSRQILKEIYTVLQIQPQNHFMANWNYETFVQKSLDNNLNRPLLFLMEHLLQTQDEASFKMALIHDLPQLLSQDQVNIFQFLTEYQPSENDLDNSDGQQKMDGCRMESLLQNPDLPILGNNELESCLVMNFKCNFNMRHEIEKHILKVCNLEEQERRAEREKLRENNQDIPLENRVEVEHSFINFIPMINKIKIDLMMQRPPSSLSYTQYLSRINKKPQEFDYIDDLFLADMFSNSESNLEFFKQETVQKIINRQFNYTAHFIKRLLIIYSCGFVVPQILNIYINGQSLEQDLSNKQAVFQLFLYLLCGTTQFFFITLEFAEVKYSGWSNYFGDPFNYMDSTQSIFYLMQIYLKCDQLQTKKKNKKMEDEHNAEKFWLEMVTIICLIQSAAKFLQLIRYNESFCYLVEMLMQVSKDIYPFLIVFFTFCAVFVLITYILEGGYDTEGYTYLEKFPMIINILQTFRNSIGDLKEPNLGKWIRASDDDLKSDVPTLDGYQYAVMFVTWFFFIMNIFIMQIVLLNFLIAEVSMTYDRIKNLGSCLLFQKKQELNFFVQKVLKVYDKHDAFKALIFTSPRFVEGEEDEQADLKDNLKNHISYEVGKLTQELIPNQKKILEQCTNNSNFIKEADDKVQKMQDQINKIYKVQLELSSSAEQLPMHQQPANEMSMSPV